jgi:predicted transcriptional regulator
MADLAADLRLTRLLAVLLLCAGSFAPSASAKGIPHEFGVPALHQGDAWTYQVSGGSGGSSGGSAQLLQRSFEQQGPSASRDPDGRSIGTARLVDTQTWSDGERQTTQRWTYEVDADGATIAATHLRDGPGAESTDSISGLPGNQSVLEHAHEYPVIATTSTGPEPFCGHRSDLQGDTVALSDGVQLAGCTEAVRFIAIASRTWNDHQAVVFGLADGPESLQVWFTPDVPVPVRIVDARDGAAKVQELLAFKAGSADLQSGDALDPAPPVDLAPRTPYGLSENGVTHPFPLATAFAAATAKGELLASFFATHAGSYLQSAVYTDLRIDQHSHTEHQRRWLLVASDGASAEAVQVTQTILEAPNQLPVAAPAQAPTVDSAYAGKGPWPAPEAVPAAFPTVASLVRRWHATTSDAGQANAWGFRVTCSATCDAAKLEAWAGRDESTQPNEPEVGFASATITHRDADLLAADADGRTAWTEQVRFEREYSLAGVPLLSTGPGAEPDLVPVREAPVAERIPWTGLAAAGAVVGLAALVGWLVKAGPLAGLFSRHIPDVTAHPVRRAVLEAIRAEPGIHHSELLRRVGKGNSVVTNHLRRLAAAGLVVERQGSRFLCYFPADATRAALAAGPLVKSPVARGILAAVASAPVSGQELARRLGVEPGTITYHAQRLGQAGLVSTRRDGRFVLLEATAAGRLAAAGAA